MILIIKNHILKISSFANNIKIVFFIEIDM